MTVTTKEMTKNPSLILTTVDPDDRLIDIAIKSKPEIIFDMKNVTDTQIRKAIRLNPDIIFKFESKKFPLKPEFILLAVQKGANINPDDNSKIGKEIKQALKKAKNQNSRLIKTLVKSNIMWIEKIPNFDIEKFEPFIERLITQDNLPTPKLFYTRFPKNKEWYLYHMDLHFYVMLFEKYPFDPYTVKIQKTLMDFSYGDMLEFLMDYEIPLCDEVKIAAIKKNCSMINLIPNPSKEVQLTAIRENSETIRYIRVPHPEVQMLACQMDPNIFNDIHYEVRDPQLEAFVALIKNND